MGRSLTAVPVVLLAFTLTGCTTGDAATTSTTATDRPSAVVVADKGSGGYDLGNDRPQVTNDGLMVRRRVVIAIHPTPGADLVSLRKALDTAATRGQTSLTSIPRGVLDPALMEPVAPEMALVLPPGKTLADARRLIDPTLKSRRSLDVERYDVAAVLVHDLRFRVNSAKPAALAEAIAREGILSDALGNYTTTLGRHRLDITYTGPLLSDDLVESARGGIARRANVQPAAVIVSPRTTTGVGVDLAKEPAPQPAVVAASKAHGHGAAHPAVSPALPAVAASPHWTLGAVSAAALAALLLMLVLLTRRRRVD